MEISGKGLLHFDHETSSLIGNQTYYRTNLFSPYQPISCYESDYECICIMINGKTCSVPLNILSSVVISGAFTFTSVFMYWWNLATFALLYTENSEIFAGVLFL